MSVANNTPESTNSQPFILRNPSKYMTLTYIVSLAVIAALSIVIHIVLDVVIEQQGQTGRLVNVSGQQRMLSQRASLFTIEYLSSHSELSRSIAQQSVDTMTDNHRFLMSYHEQSDQGMSEVLSTLYFGEPYNINGQVSLFTSLISDLLAREDYPPDDIDALYELPFAQMARYDLLTGLNAVVEQYEVESVEQVDRMRLVQLIVLWIIIFTIMIEALFIFRPMVARISDLTTALQHDANVDILTQVFNRRAFNLLAKRTFDLSVRHKRELSVIVADIDHFKRVNDTYGHGAGDEVIALVAKTLRESCRETDIVARIGGEEFSVVLPDTQLKAAEVVAEKLRLAVASQEVIVSGGALSVTMSFGLSERKAMDAGIEQVLARADKCLYAAKGAGRNCVVGSIR